MKQYCTVKASRQHRNNKNVNLLHLKIQPFSKVTFIARVGLPITRLFILVSEQYISHCWSFKKVQNLFLIAAAVN